MSESSKKLPDGRLPSNLTNMQDMTGIAASLLRRGFSAKIINAKFGLSSDCIESASDHILSSDEGVVAFLEAILLRLATGYWTDETVGVGRRGGPTVRKVWHKPDVEAIKLLFDGLDRKRLGAAGRSRPLPPPKPKKQDPNLGITINLAPYEDQPVGSTDDTTGSTDG